MRKKKDNKKNYVFICSCVYIFIKIIYDKYIPTRLN